MFDLMKHPAGNTQNVNKTRGFSMYVTGNPKTKKALKECVAAAQSEQGRAAGVPGPEVFSPGPFPAKANGVEFVEGPQYPAAHTWYAKVAVENGEIVKVLS